MIREPTLDDIPQLLALGHAMHAESPRYRRLPFNEAKLETMLHNLLASEGNCSFVAESGHLLTGVILAVVAPHYFTDALIATDIALFISPERRGAALCGQLLEAYERKAKRLGALEVSVGISAEVHADRTAALLARYGYAQTGYMMVKRVGDV